MAAINADAPAGTPINTMFDPLHYFSVILMLTVILTITITITKRPL